MSLPPPKAVIFDLGKVLVDFDYSLAARRIAARSSVSPGQVRELIEHSTLLFRFETGRLSVPEFFTAVQAGTGFTGSLEEFSHLFADIFTPIPSMIETQAELRRHGVPTYIFSNTNELAVTHIRAAFPFFSEFDGYVLSYQHGAMKPEEELYEVVERITGLRGADLLYLDDRAENVATGRTRGWRAVMHETPESSREAIHQIFGSFRR